MHARTKSPKIAGLSKTTKTHVLLKHVPEFCRQEGKGLGHFSEQVFEHLHSRFAEFSRYRLPSIMTTPEYAEALLKVTKEFNISHY